MGEFELIERFFKPESPPPRGAGTAPPASAGSGVRLGIGDDCALLALAPGMELAVSSDMLVEGRHFFADMEPAALGHKALAVNLSDLAACGAKPLAFTLALALPPERADDAAWLAAFAHGLRALAAQHACPLVGGDTTAGPLNLCITVLGEVPAGQALRRDGARPGDDVWASGTLGDARLALQALRGQIALAPPVLAAARQRLERPTPRVALGQALRGIASACIDVSDGLAGDLGHVLAASHVGATLEAELCAAACAAPLGDAGQRLQCVLYGGDDYELAFTAPPAQRPAVLRAAQTAGTPVTRLGRIEAEPGLRLKQPDGPCTPIAARGFDHFGC